MDQKVVLRESILNSRDEIRSASQRSTHASACGSSSSLASCWCYGEQQPGHPVTPPASATASSKQLMRMLCGVNRSTSEWVVSADLSQKEETHFVTRGLFIYSLLRPVVQECFPSESSSNARLTFAILIPREKHKNIVRLSFICLIYLFIQNV